MADDRSIQEIKNESRAIQQRMHEVEVKLTAEIHELKDKINRIEALLNDRLGQIHNCTENTLANTGRIRSDLESMKAQNHQNPEMF